MTKNPDVYTRITETIIAELEQGTRPWAQPWQAAHAAGPVSRPLRACGQPYSGINVVMLWLAGHEAGLRRPALDEPPGTQPHRAHLSRPASSPAGFWPPGRTCRSSVFWPEVPGRPIDRPRRKVGAVFRSPGADASPLPPPGGRLSRPPQERDVKVAGLTRA